MERDTNKYRRRYDADFKRQAVALVEGGRTVTEVARDLGCSHWSLSRWVQDSRDGLKPTESCSIAQETPEQRELRRMRQELEYLRRQRDILKKALGILSAEMPLHSSK